MVGFNHHFPYHCWVTKSCLTLPPPRLQHAGLPCPHLLLEFAQTRVHWVSDVILPSHPLLPLLLLPSVFPSIGVFSNESPLHSRWPKYCSFNFSISPSNDYSGLITFRTDWFDILASKGLSRVFDSWHQFLAALSLLYGLTLTLVHDYWNNHSFDYLELCQQSDSSAFKYAVKVWHVFPSMEQASFNFMAAVTVHSDFRAQENKVYHCFHFSPTICHEVMGLDTMIFIFWMLSFRPVFSLSSFTFIKRLFSSSSFSALRVVLSSYLKLLTFLPTILISACESSSPAFRMMYSV